jgi:hypothetical protein
MRGWGLLGVLFRYLAFLFYLFGFGFAFVFGFFVGCNE